MAQDLRFGSGRLAGSGGGGVIGIGAPAGAAASAGSGALKVRRMDRYFPSCWGSVVEAVAAFRFGIEDLGCIYGRHSFRYAKPPGPLRLRENGIELDAEFSRVPLEPGALSSRILSCYGIRVGQLAFRDFAGYLEHCRESLASGVPVITDFDLGFTRGRREYGRLFQPHVIALTGMREDGKEPVVLASEQMLGPVEIAWKDFRGCMERILSAGGAIGTTVLTREAGSGTGLSRADALAQARANLANLRSADPREGLRAILTFRADIAEFLAGPDGRRPFAIPGLWVFSHERHAARKWLRALRGPGAAGPGPAPAGFDALLESLFSRWLNLDFLIEKGLAQGGVPATASIPGQLDGLASGESLAADAWEELALSLSAAGTAA